MEEDSGGEIVEAVITCDGEIDDPGFKKNFGSLLRRLKKRITGGFGKGPDLVVTKMEPWNSVRVTFSIPREAALRLRQLAQQGDATLRTLGILTVQVEGDQVISLTLAGRNNGPPQEIVLRTEEAGAATAPQRSLAELMYGDGERPLPPPPPPPPAAPPAFRSPNVVAPVSQPLPYPAKLQQRAGAATYPFNSMSHAAAAAVGHRELPQPTLPPPPPPPPYPGGGQQQQQQTAAAPPPPPPPQPAPPPPPPPQPAQQPPQAVALAGGSARDAPLKSPALSSIGSPLLVNLLKNEPNSAEAAHHRAQHAPPQQHQQQPPQPQAQQPVRLAAQQQPVRLALQHRMSPVMQVSQRGAPMAVQQVVRRSPVGVPARVSSPAGLAQAAAARHSPVQLPLRVSPVQLPGSSAARPPAPGVTRPHPTRVALVAHQGRHHVAMAHGAQPVGNGGLVLVNNGPARPGQQPTRVYSNHMKPARPTLQHVLSGAPRPHRPEAAPRPAGGAPPGVSSAAAASSPSSAHIRPGPAGAGGAAVATSSPSAPLAKAHLSPGSSQGGAGVAPASGKPRQLLINPLTGLLEPMPTSDSSSDSEPERARSPFPENSNSIFSDEESNQSLPNMSDSEASKLSLLSGASDGRRASRGGTPSPRSVSTSPAAEKIKLRLKLEKAEPVSPVSPTYKVDVSFGGSGAGAARRPDRAAGNGAPAAAAAPGGEEPRVPPLHISLRGRNAAVVVSKDGAAVKSKDKLKPKLKSTKEKEDAPADALLSAAEDTPLKIKLKDPALKARAKDKDKVKRVKRKEDSSDKGVGVKVVKPCDKDGTSCGAPPKDSGLVNHVYGLHDDLDLKHIPPVPPEDIFSPDPWEPRPARPPPEPAAPPPPPPAASTSLALTVAALPTQKQAPAPAVTPVTVAAVTCLQPASPAALESALRAGRAEGDALRKEVLTHCLEKKVNDVCATTSASAVRLGEVLGACTSLALTKVEGLADSPSVTPKGDPSNGQGEDSGIESMDTQSEKSPNQEESPHRKEELDSEKHEPASHGHKTESVPVTVTDQPSERVPSRTFKTESITVTVNTHNSSDSVCPAASVASANPTSVSGDDKVQVVIKVNKQEESVISTSSNPTETRAEPAAGAGGSKPPPEPSGARAAVAAAPPVAPPPAPAVSDKPPPPPPPAVPEKPPATVADKPKAAVPDNPPALVAKPDKPAAVKDKPAATVTAKPTAVADKPATEPAKPPAVQDKPAPVPEKPAPASDKPTAAQDKPPPATDAEPPAEKSGSGHAQRVNNINSIVAKLQRCTEPTGDRSAAVQFAAGQGGASDAPTAGRATSDAATTASPAVSVAATVVKAAAAPAAPVATTPPAVSVAPATPVAVAVAKEAPAKPADPPAEARNRPEPAATAVTTATTTTALADSRQDATPPPAVSTPTPPPPTTAPAEQPAKPAADESKPQPAPVTAAAAAAAAPTGRTTPLNLPPGSKMLPIKLIKAVNPATRPGAGSPLPQVPLQASSLRAAPPPAVALKAPATPTPSASAPGRPAEREPSPEPPVLSPAESGEARPPGVRRSDSKELPPDLEQPSADEPELLRVKPPLYTYSNPDKARESSPPASADGAEAEEAETLTVDPSRLLKEILLHKEAVSKVESDHSYLKPNRKGLEELSIQIPDAEAEEKRTTRCTRANSRLHSPTVASPTPARASPVARAAAAPSPRAGKRRRFESGGSGAGAGEEPSRRADTPDTDGAGPERSRRRCSENAAGLIKACMGMDEQRTRPGTPNTTGRRDEPPRRARAAAAAAASKKEEASDDESDRRSTRSTDEPRAPSRTTPRSNHAAAASSSPAPTSGAAAAAAKSDDKLSQERSTGRASRSRARENKATSRSGSAESLDGGAGRKGRQPAKPRAEPEREPAAAAAPTASKRKLRNSAAGQLDSDASAAKRRRVSRDK